MTNPLAADIMRLNKSFIVERGVSGTRAVLKSLTRTSSYIRHSIQQDEVSVWIAQRQGRAKDGYDRTDPALLKMLALAYKEADDSLNTMLEEARLVPVSVSYELDPVAPRKAHELFVTAATGAYDKADEEDVESMIEGLAGFKGRVHLVIHPPVKGPAEDAGHLAEQIDRAIVSGLRVFPTHAWAANQTLAKPDRVVSSCAVLPEVMQALEQDLDRCPHAEREYLMLQYANTVTNQRDVALAQTG